MLHRSRVLIAGAGPAGYTAAIYASRAGLDTTLLTGPLPGGQLLNTQHIENYPGHFGQPAPELVHTMYKQCSALPITMLPHTAVKINKHAHTIDVLDSIGGTHTSDAVIITTGANPKLLGIPNEERLMGAGISTCATCDGHFYRNQNVAVIGGGNTATEEAIYLSGIARTVHLIHRRDSLRAEATLQQALFELPNLQFHWNTSVVAFVGDQVLEKLALSDGTELSVEGAFVAIGHTPNSAWCKEVLTLHSDGYIKTYTPHGEASITPQPYTSVPGIFVAGDVCDSRYRQAITAAGQGCVAAIEAYKWLRKGPTDPSAHH